MQVNEGEIFALLGPNGAGKTTTIEILEGFQRPTSGSVSVLGFNPNEHHREFKDRVGIVLQNSAVDQFLNVEESLKLVSRYYRNSLDIETVLHTTGLNEVRGKRPSVLSGGYQRRLDVALGLTGNPDLLFLDEPTTGFDPAARRDAWDMISNLRTLGKTVLLTTHYMDEVEHLADRAAILVGGEIVKQGTPIELVSQHLTQITFNLPDVPRDFKISFEDRLIQEGSSFHLNSRKPTQDLFELTQWATSHGVELSGLNVTKPSLDDVFIELSRQS